MPDLTHDVPCRACGGDKFDTLLDFGQQPIAHRLLASPVEHEERFPLHIEYCLRCGLGQIRAPIDPATLYRGYNYCFSSWKPEPHMTSELDLISARTSATSVFEVGCNDGRFMAELRDRGVGLGVGLEPNPFAAALARDRGFMVHEAFLSDAQCDQILEQHGRFDLVVARQVLEHLHDIGLFFRCAARLLAQEGVLFIDLPDIAPSVDAGDCTIAWEEHVNYFTHDTLQFTLAVNGFKPIATTTYNFSGGALAVLAKRASAGRLESQPVVALDRLRRFRDRVADYQNALHEALDAERRANIPVVLYGVGVRACAAVNGLGLGAKIDFAVDDQPERIGKFMPGSRLEIRGSAAIPPGALVLLAVNQENEMLVHEKTLARAPASGLRFLSLLGPNDVALALQNLTTSRVSS